MFKYRKNMFTRLIYLFLINLSASYSALLNEACDSPDDCATRNSVCSPLSPICAPYGSYCQCANGFKEDRGRCKKLVFLNEDCGENSICANAKNHLFCNSATAKCECDIGYRPAATLAASQPPTCVVDSKRGNVGDDCTIDPVDTCGENMECVDGTCSCSSGYYYQTDLKQCSPIGLGNSCSDDQDCFNVIRSVCNPTSKICECPAGFLAGSVTFKKEPVSVCLLTSNVPKELGDRCNEIGPAQRTYCAQPFVCTTCTPNNSVSFCTPPAFPTTNTPRISSPQTTTPKLTTTGLMPNSTSNVDYNEYEITDDVTKRRTTTTEQPKIRTTTTPEAKSVLGDDCSRDADCGVLFSKCQNGTCRCQDGYRSRGFRECRENFDRIGLGQECDASLDAGLCATANAACINSTCQCIVGFKTGPKMDDCVDVGNQFGFGEYCDSSDECYYNLVCLQSQCLCSPGYKQAGTFGCRKRILEDECPSGRNVECRFVKNATCTAEKYCKCLPGFTRQSASKCVPLEISQPDEDWSSWQVSCVKDVDCITPAAPAMSRCLRPSLTCGCPQNSFYDQSRNRCLYKASDSDLGYGCLVDSDCPRRSRCIRNTCGGTAPFPLIASSTSNIIMQFKYYISASIPLSNVLLLFLRQR